MKTNRNKKSYRKGLISFIISFCFIYAINTHLFVEDDYGRLTTLNVFLFLFITYFLYNSTTPDRMTKRAVRCSYILSLLYGLALVLGRSVSDNNSIGPLFSSPLVFTGTLIAILSFTIVFGRINILIYGRLQSFRYQSVEEHSWKLTVIRGFLTSRHLYVKLWLSLFICWLPCFISYYPGIFSYDMPYQAIQAAGGIECINKHHPPLHTLIWYVCYNLEKVSGIPGIAIYGIMQMLLLSAVISALLIYIINRHIDYRIIIGSILFFAINPVIAICSFIPTKDILFSITFILFMMLSADYIRDPETLSFKVSKKKPIMLILSIVLCCLFRNNAFYLFVLFIPFVVVVFRKIWKRVLIIFLIPLVLFKVIDTGIFTCIYNMPKGETAEMLSVPIEQIATVVINERENLTDEEVSLISSCVDIDQIPANYNPRLSDYIKGMFNNTEFDENKWEFIKLWFKLLIRYPNHYINAFLSLNMPYWYPDASTLDRYSQRVYIETAIYDSDVVSYTRSDYLPYLNKFYEKAASYELFKNIPVLANIFSIATPLWILLICLFRILATGRKRIFLFVLPGLLLMLTYIAGPVSNFRYIFAIFTLYPFYLACIFQPDKLLISENINTKIKGREQKNG